MEILEREGFSVVGVEARTSNEREMAPDGGGVIPAVWQRFHALCPDDSGPFFAVYTDYQSDEHGEYTYMVGSKGVKTSADTVIRQIPSGRYWKLTTERGPVWQVVPAAWRQVWGNSAVTRTFATDFEVYDERAANPADAVVELWVGIR